MMNYVALRSWPALGLSRVASYTQLVRPRMGLLVVATVSAGGVLAAEGNPDWNILAQTSIATALLFAGASSLNQLIERRTDSLMARTADRPLPAGLLQPWEALVLGCTLAGSGLAALLAANQPLAAALGAVALVIYVLVYTPLKRRTPLNTLIGAIPGAVPPLMGWACVRGRLDGAAALLFLIVFLWQVPHFLAIAWIYRDEYARAGLRMFPLFDPSGVRTGRQMVGYSLALIPVSLTPVVTSGDGWITAAAVLLAGVVFLFTTVVFARNRTMHHARQVFRASVLFLAVLLLLFVLGALVPIGR
jgi:protoheme IX farnesyltransferase